MKPTSWTPPVWLSFVLLVGTLGYLLVQWGSHPVPGSEVVGPVILLITGITLGLTLEGILYLNNLKLKGETNQHLAPEANELLTRVTGEIVRMVELSLAVPFAVGTILGLGHKGGIHPIFGVICVVAVGGVILLACLRLNACAKDLRARGLDKGLEGWNGVIYSNKNDSRIWVPKLGSIGYTLNFAHSRSWVILALLVSPAFLVAILALIVKLWR